MIFSGNNAIKYLAGEVNKPDKAESSHWNKYHSQFKFTGDGFTGLQGFGGYSRPYSGVRKIAHLVLQKPYRKLGESFSDFNEIDSAASRIATKQGRAYDLDLLRQTLTLSFLMKKRETYLSENMNVCVIGDGFASMTCLLLATQFFHNVILVNLSKTLLVDLWYLKLYLGETEFESGVRLISQYHHDDESGMSINKETVESFSVVAIEAKNHKVIRNMPIDLIINIASMQEMDVSVIKSYFNDFRKISNRKKLLFYCCNREEKLLPDGTLIRLSEYPWSKADEVFVDELCPWHQKYYLFKPPFYHSYDGPIRHRFVRLSG